MLEKVASFKDLIGLAVGSQADLHVRTRRVGWRACMYPSVEQTGRSSPGSQRWMNDLEVSLLMNVAHDAEKDLWIVGMAVDVNVLWEGFEGEIL